MRHLQQYPCTRCMPHSARRRWFHDGARGTAYAGADVREVRPSAHDELRFDTGVDCSYAWAYRRRPDRSLSSLAGDLFSQHSYRLDWLDHGVSASAGLPGGDAPAGCCGIDSVWVWDCAAVLCAGSFWRAHAECTRDLWIACAFSRIARWLLAAREDSRLPITRTRFI